MWGHVTEHPWNRRTRGEFGAIAQVRAGLDLEWETNWEGLGWRQETGGGVRKMVGSQVPAKAKLDRQAMSAGRRLEVMLSSSSRTGFA